MSIRPWWSRFVLSRAGYYWPVLTTLVLGVVLATALLSSGPLLVDTALDTSLQHTLLDASSRALSDPLSAHLRLEASLDPAPERRGPGLAKAYDDLDARLAALIKERMRPGPLEVARDSYVARIIPAGETRWAFPWIEGQLDTRQRVNVRFYDRLIEEGQPALLSQVEFLDGAWPVAAAQVTENVPVVIGETMARSYGLAVGDHLPVSLREDGVQPDLVLEISGIVRPVRAKTHARDATPAYWFGSFSPLLSQKSARYETQFGVLVSPDRFFELAETVYAPSQVRLAWNVLLRPSTMRVKDLPRFRARLATLKDDLAAWEQDVVLESELDTTLAEFTQRSLDIRFPLYLMTAAIALLALYYVIMAASLWLRQVQREVSLLRSRGAFAGQILSLQIGEASLLGGIAMLCGPLLALLIVRSLARWGPMSSLGVLTSLAAPALWAVPKSAWLWAGVGCAACVVALLAYVPASLRGAESGATVVAHQASLSRAPGTPWWQRLYLDVIVFAIGLVLIWRARTQTSGLNGIELDVASAPVDWLLVLAPLALLMGAAVVLRVFPLILRWGAGLASRGRGLPAPLALWQVSRDPVLAARLVLLLALAMALGILARGLSQALDQNEVDQSFYAVGGDVRVLGGALGTQTLAGASGTTGSVAHVWRDKGTLSVHSAGAYPEFELLAIEPRTYARVARFRKDFSDRPISDLLGTLDVSQVQILQDVLGLPGEPDRLGVWLWMPGEEGGPSAAARSTSRPRVSRVSVEAKLQDANGDLFTMRLRRVESSMLEQRPVQEGWHAFEGALPAGAVSESAVPISLHSLWFRNADLPLVLQDLMVRDRVHSEVQVVEATLDHWQICGQRSGGLVGLQPGDCPTVEPFPALISSALQEKAQVRVGDRFGAWIRSEPCEFVVTGIVRHWPTLYERALHEHGAGFLVTARDPLLLHLNSADKTPILGNELVAALPGGDGAAFGIVQQQDGVDISYASDVRQRIRADSMALGLRSAARLSFFVATALSLVGFGTHFYLSTRQRQGSFVVLRALGVSPRQLYGSLLLEQALLVVSGLALGTLLGLMLLHLIVPGLPLRLGGVPPVPPFVVRIDWTTIARLYAALGTSFVIVVGIATGMLWRARLHRALRVEQE